MQRKKSENDQLYALVATENKDFGGKRILGTRMTLMLTAGMSKLNYTGLIFVDAGVKVDGAYYYNLLLSRLLLPAIHQVFGVLIYRITHEMPNPDNHMATEDTPFGTLMFQQVEQQRVRNLVGFLTNAALHNYYVPVKWF